MNKLFHLCKIQRRPFDINQGKTPALLFMMMSLSGCAAIGQVYDRSRDMVDPEGGGRPATISGTLQVTPREGYDKIDLIDLIIVNSALPPGADAPMAPRLNSSFNSISCNDLVGLRRAVNSVTGDEDRANSARAIFNTCPSKTLAAANYDSIESRRNRIQDAVMTVSKRNCEVYKLMMASIDSHSDFMLGTASMVSGLAGALATPATSARVFSTLAGGFSGLNAQLGRSFFKDTAVSVIFTGIDLKRMSIQGKIDEAKKKSIAEYSLDYAISDAFRYNGACSAVEGLGEVKDRIAKPVGLEQAIAVIQQANLARDIAQASALPPAQREAAFAALYKATKEEEKYLSLRSGGGGQASESTSNSQASALIDSVLANLGTYSQIIASLEELQREETQKSNSKASHSASLSKAVSDRDAAEKKWDAAKGSYNNASADNCEFQITSAISAKEEDIAACRTYLKLRADATAEQSLINQLETDLTLLASKISLLRGIQAEHENLTKTLQDRLKNSTPLQITAGMTLAGIKPAVTVTTANQPDAIARIMALVPTSTTDTLKKIGTAISPK